MSIYNIVVATGIPTLNSTLEARSDVNVVGVANFKNEIHDMVEKLSPDIVLITDKISGDENLIKLMLSIKRDYNNLRILYFAGELSSRDYARFDAIGTLVLAGIYDIDTSKKLNIDIVMDLIENPKTEAAVNYYTKNILNNTAEINNAYSGIEYEEYREDKESNRIILNNLIAFTSIKPGSGKSFSAVNVACAIAKYGKNKPRVALIEGDLQTLSIGTLLGVDEDKDKNIKAAMQAVSSLYRDGIMTDDGERIKKANKKIKSCLVKYKYLNNLDVLVGSSITPEEIDIMDIKPEFYTYIINAIKDEYDVIIVDTNSSLYHISGFPMIQMAKECYYILNLDFNNIRNNLRYKKTIRDIGIEDKAKYILNENIENTKEFTESGVDDEELNFTAEAIENKYFNFVAKIPVLPKTVFLNRLYDGTPVVMDSNDIDYTNLAKFEIMKVADGIWPMNEEYQKLDDKLHHKHVSGFFANLFRRKNKPEARASVTAKKINSDELQKKLASDEDES